MTTIDLICDELRVSAPRAPESLRAQVRTLVPVAQPRRLPSLRRPLLLAAPAAAGLLVAVAIGHGILSSGNETRAVPPKPLPATTVAGAAEGTKRQPAPTQVWSAQDGAAAGAGAFAPSVNRIQHFEASLTLRVRGRDRLDSATSQALGVVRSLGGYAASVRQVDRGDHDAQAYLELRVPAARVQAALASLSGLGAVVSQQLSVQDLQAELDAQREKILQLRETIALVQQQLRNSALPADQRVRLEAQLAASKRALARWQSRAHGTVAQGRLARVSLVIATQKAGAAASPGRFERAAKDALHFLAAAGAVALYILIVLAPLALAFGLALAASRAWRRWDARRLLET